MAELRKAVGIKVELVEELVKKHFGPGFTSKITWSFAKGKYIPSTLPRRVAAPQKVLGLRIGWKTIGEFTTRASAWNCGTRPASARRRHW